MAWVKLDDEFSSNPKVLEAGPLGMALQVAALCYCNRHLTDGRLPHPAAAALLSFEGLGMRMWSGELVGHGEDARWELVAEDLVSAGVWHKPGHDCDECPPISSGFYLHGYLDFQPSKAEVVAAREAKQEAGRRGGRASVEARAQARAQAGAQAESKQDASRRSSKSQAESNPDPVPDPDTHHHQSSTHDGNERAAADDDEAPQAERKLPRTAIRQQRAVEACELIGDRNHDRAVVQGRVHNVAAHRQACRSSARTDHLETAQRLAADHPDWTPRQLAEHVNAPEHPPAVGPDVKRHMEAVERARRDYDAALPERAPVEALTSGVAAAKAALRPDLRVVLGDPTAATGTDT